MTWKQNAPDETITEDEGSSAPVSQSSPNDAAVPLCPTHGTLPIDSIRTGQNIRATFDDSQIEELASSIALHGILEPLIVSEAADGSGEYLLIAGERRYRAARAVGLETAPCQIYPALSSQQILEMMFAENLQRVDLNPIDEARGIRRMLDLGITQAELGERLGRSQSWVANRLRLLEVPSEVQDRVISQEITPAHVLQLLTYQDCPRYDEFVAYFMKSCSKKVPTVAEIDLVFGRWAGTLGSSVARYFSYSVGEEQYARCMECPRFFKDVCFDVQCLEGMRSRQEAARHVPDDDAIAVFPEPGTWRFRENPVRPDVCGDCPNLVLNEGLGRMECHDPACFRQTSERIKEAIRKESQELRASVIEDAVSVISQESASDLASRFCSRLSDLLCRSGSELVTLDIQPDDSPETILTMILVNLVASDINLGYVDDDTLVTGYVRCLRDHGLKASPRFVQMAKAIESEKKSSDGRQGASA